MAKPSGGGWVGAAPFPPPNIARAVKAALGRQAAVEARKLAPRRAGALAASIREAPGRAALKALFYAKYQDRGAFLAEAGAAAAKTDVAERAAGEVIAEAIRKAR